MYVLQHEGKSGRDARLLAPRGLARGDFDALAAELGVSPRSAHKVDHLAARCATQRETVVTHWNGEETSNVAEPGDYVVSSLGADRTPLQDRDGNLNTYVIKAKRFPDLYERETGTIEQGEVYRAKGEVEAIHLPGGFDILAPWGERQVAPDGYLLRNGSEVYGNNRETFESTYAWGPRPR